jgi:hypothetical protein
MSMKRRGFFTAFTAGAAATVVGGAKHAQAASAATEKRDIHWAKKMTEMGFRVRLESWVVPVEERESLTDEHDAGITMRMGQPSGVASIDELVVTFEMMEGPWECVPEDDMPKPPKPPEPQGFIPGDGNLWVSSFDPDQGNDLTLTAGRGGHIRMRGGKKS